METGNHCGSKIYDEPEQANLDLAYLTLSEELNKPDTSTPDETRLAFLKRIIEAFNELEWIKSAR